MQKLLRFYLFLLALIFIVPFISTFNSGTLPAVYFNTFGEYLAITCLLFSLIFVALIIIDKSIINISFTSILLCLFVIYLFLQYTILKSSYVSPYINTISVVVLLVIAIISIDNLSINPKTFYNVVAIAILICCYLQIIESTLQLTQSGFKINKILFYGFERPYFMNFEPFGMPDYKRIVGGLGQPNNLADILTWGFIANIYLFFNNNKTVLKAFYYFNSFIISLFIGFTQSRAAFFYPVILIFYSLFTFKKSPRLASHLIVNCIVLLLFISIPTHILNLINHLSSATEEHLSVISTARDEATKGTSTSQRYYFWVKGLIIFLQHPVLGVGWSNFYGSFVSTQIPFHLKWQMADGGVVGNSHNILVEFLSTTGIIGTLLLFTFIAYRFWQLSKIEIDLKILPIGIALIAFSHSLVEFPLFVGHIFIAFMLIFCPFDNKNFTIHQFSKLYKTVILFILSISIVILTLNINTLLELSQMKKPNNYAINNIQYNIFNLYQKSTTNIYFDSAADYVLLNNMIITDRTQQNSKLFDLYYNVLNRAITTNPNPQYLMNRVVMNIIYGKIDEAQQDINNLMSTYPNYTTSLKEIAKLHSGNNTKVYQQIITMIDSNK